jgi:regulatory protein
MKLTKIVQQQRQKDRYSIYVDEKYVFSLSEGALLAAGLSTGMELTREDLKGYKKLSADDKAFNRALRYAAMRRRSEWEMTDYLRRKLVEEPVAQKIIVKLRRLDLVNDAAFAQAWVENRRLLKPVSKRRLVQELKQKRVAEDVINQVLQEDTADERVVLMELIERKRRQTKYQDQEKLMQYLARQGFGYQDIKSVIEEMDQESSES